MSVPQKKGPSRKRTPERADATLGFADVAAGDTDSALEPGDPSEPAGQAVVDSEAVANRAAVDAPQPSEAPNGKRSADAAPAGRSAVPGSERDRDDPGDAPSEDRAASAELAFAEEPSEGRTPMISAQAESAARAASVVSGLPGGNRDLRLAIAIVVVITVLLVIAAVVGFAVTG